MNDVGGGIWLVLRLRFDWRRSVDLGVSGHLLVATDTGRGVVALFVMLMKLMMHWQEEVLMVLVLVWSRGLCWLADFVGKRCGGLEFDSHLLDFVYRERVGHRARSGTAPTVLKHKHNNVNQQF